MTARAVFAPRHAAAMVVAGALLLSGCGGSDADEGQQPSSPGARLEVVATLTIWGQLTQRLVGDAGDVTVLMEPGQDPHGFAPSARQAEELRGADLVVANGLDLEEGLLDALAAAEQDGVAVLRLAEQLDPLAVDEEPGEHDEQEEAGHEHGDEDPHVWTDPVRVADAVRLIAAKLDEVDTDRPSSDWQQAGDDLAEEILAAHGEAEDVLAAVPQECRLLVTNHEALRYFADRYGFEMVGSVIPGTSTQAEPSARDFAELAELLRENRVPAIFAETTESTRLAESLAAEAGRDITTVRLYTGSLGPPGSGAETYAGMVVTNARLVADALADC